MCCHTRDVPVSLEQCLRSRLFIFTNLDRPEMSPDQAPHLETTEDRRVLPHARRTGESFAIVEVQFLDIYKLGQTGNVT